MKKYHYCVTVIFHYQCFVMIGETPHKNALNRVNNRCDVSICIVITFHIFVITILKIGGTPGSPLPPPALRGISIYYLFR
jgi:hypothetical protein